MTKLKAMKANVLISMFFVLLTAITNKPVFALEINGLCQKPDDVKKWLIDNGQRLVIGAVDATDNTINYYTLNTLSGVGFQISATETPAKCLTPVRSFLHAELYDVKASDVDENSKLPAISGPLINKMCEGHSGCHFLNDLLADLKHNHSSGVYFQGLFEIPNTNGERGIYSVIGKQEAGVEQNRGVLVVSTRQGMSQIVGGFQDVKYVGSASDVLAERKNICEANPKADRCAGWPAEH